MGFIGRNFLFRHVVFTLPDGMKNKSVLRNGLYHGAILGISGHEMGHIRVRNGLFRNAV